MLRCDPKTVGHDFSKMTCSVVAVATDVVRNGKPVVGYGFNSNGRYGQGCLIRERFRPRILEAFLSYIESERYDMTNSAGQTMRGEMTVGFFKLSFSRDGRGPSFLCAKLM
jgi:hypothetical protein